MLLRNSIDLGHVRAGQTIHVKFPYDYMGEILDVKSTCDCATVYNDTASHEIVITYKPNSVPKQLIVQGWYKANKTVTIQYTSQDGTTVTEELKFTARVGR
jgi:hypothetical protein